MKTWMCDKDVFNTILDTFCGTFMNTPVDRKSEEGRVISKILEAATTPVRCVLWSRRVVCDFLG